MSNRLESLAGTVDRVAGLAERTARARALVSRDARRRKTAGENSRKILSGAAREALYPLRCRSPGRRDALAEAKTDAERVREELAAATAAAEEATAATAASDRRLSELRATLASGASRREAISRKLERSANAKGSEQALGAVRRQGGEGGHKARHDRPPAQECLAAPPGRVRRGAPAGLRGAYDALAQDRGSRGQARHRPRPRRTPRRRGVQGRIRGGRSRRGDTGGVGRHPRCGPQGGREA